MGKGKHMFAARIYHTLCLFAAIGLTSWCIYEYNLDCDVTEIVLHKYHETSDDIHPSITICYKRPYISQKYVSNYNQNLSLVQAEKVLDWYSTLLSGNKHLFKASTSEEGKIDEKLLQTLEAIDYDDVTISLNDIISEFEITIPINFEQIYHFLYHVVNNSMVIKETSSVGLLTWDVDTDSNGTLQTEALNGFKYINTYISARQDNHKCFTFDVPIEPGIEIRQIRIRLDPSIFPWGLDLSQIYMTLTYPGQFLRSSRGNQIDLPVRRRAQCYKFETHVGSMEVFKRRDKIQSPCNVDWRHQDERQLNDILGKVGCNPKHWKIQSHLPNCSTVEQYAELNKEIYQKDGFMPPCRSIEKLSKVTKGEDLGFRCLFNSYLDLKFFLDKDTLYKEIVLVRSYSAQSLIGNAGKSLNNSPIDYYIRKVKHL